MSPYHASPPRYAQIVTAIEQRIADGTYPLGSKIPSETQLLAEFKVSRPTVINALRILNDMGLIETRYGIGRFVRERDPAAGMTAEVASYILRLHLALAPEGLGADDPQDYDAALLKRAIGLAGHLFPAGTLWWADDLP